MNAIISAIVGKALPYLAPAGQWLAWAAVLAFNFAKAHVADTVLVVLLGSVLLMTDSGLAWLLIIAMVGASAYVGAKISGNLKP